MKQINGNKFHMPGTEGTGRYMVIAATARGRVGVRVLDGALDKMSRVSIARVRVEPNSKPSVIKKMSEKLPDGKWKQPGYEGQHRFSCVVHNGKSKGKSLRINVSDALVAIGVGELQKVDINPEAPAWAQGLVASL